MGNCCCGIITSVDPQPFFAKCAKKPGTWSLFSLQDMVKPLDDIHSIRARLVNEIPFRNRPCPHYFLTCCGSCTKVCNNRCIQDIIHRVHMMYNSGQQSYPYQLLRKIAGDPSTTYKQYLASVTEIINPKTNTELKQFDENPHKLEYAPMYKGATSKKSGLFKKQYDDITGQVNLYEWPESGLCPYCLPKVLVNKRKVKQNEQT